MRLHHIATIGLAAVTLGACSTYDDDYEETYVAEAPPVGPGALVGTVAADRDGNGVVDGYYDANGNYFAFQAPPCPPPPQPTVQPYGERG
ncbi:hypothetical protein [Aurantiacibacter spongiae]|uniref:Uncharacterized protein n=1 Tax=Aurantiacibacter spongiae TaxID=2488860 RepID=A0A3N5DAF9_9SPHN|nr:hypothetical protein [Aurantiacibacter spongiae]RPF71658.1 hypothetical protein EG799_08515 [Aurantiacibacter spongiae]